MHHQVSRKVTPALFILISILFISLPCYAQPASVQTTQAARTPTDTVREFYKALQEKRFRDAIAMSVFQPAIQGLSAAEIEELRPEFEKLSTGAEKVKITGEQLSGDRATVFVKLADDEANAPPAEVPLKRVGANWIIFDEQAEQEIKQAGNAYFFRERIEIAETEAKEMLGRVAKAEFVYAAQHGGQYADIPALIKEGLLPKDIETTESTGYRYHVTLSKDGKTFTAGAEPARYGRTGRLSFHLDKSGSLKGSDTGGKPYNPPAEKK